MPNCLVSMRNKKINNSAEVGAILDAFSAAGFHFDKVSLIAYDSSDEIVAALTDGAERYDNLLIHCPAVMDGTIRSFLENLTGCEFDERGVLKGDKVYVYLLFSDGENKLHCPEIIDIMDRRYNLKFDCAYVKTVGASSEEIAYAINAASGLADVNFEVSEQYGECTIRIIYSEQTPKMSVDAVIRSLLTTLNDYVYAMEDVTLAQRLFQLLKLRRMRISVAESFTGGGVCKKLVEVPGVSEVFYEGLNTYSNDSKRERLHVKELTLIQNGAVSKETAYQMADGLLQTGNCDVSIATTGIAGPKSDNTAKPVGLIYIAVGTAEQISVFQYNLKGSRDEITNTAINLALFLTYKQLK